MNGAPVKKELILINPSVSNLLIRAILLFFKRRVPLSLLTLWGLTPSDYQVKIRNQKILWRRKDFTGGALVGITCLTSSCHQAYKLARRFRASGATVVMGGPHVSVLPEEALQYCHSVVIGEAESVWPQVIRDFENSSLQRIYKGPLLEDFFSPVYEHFMRINPAFLRRAGISARRGCKYRCDFCACPFKWPRFVKIDQIVNIMRRIKESTRFPFFYLLPFTFVEDNIYSDPEYARRLFKELAPLKIRWISLASLDIAFDDEALKLARDSGCQALLIGFETIYPEKMQKTSLPGITCRQDYIKAIRKIKSHGIKVMGAFIIGLEDYRHLDYLRLLVFLAETFIKSRFYWISLTILTPYPGSELFERLKREGRLLSYNWARYDLFFNVVFRPKYMSSLCVLLWFVVIRSVSCLLSTLGIAIFIIINLPDIFFFVRRRTLAFLYGVNF